MQKTLTRAGLAALALTGAAFLLTVPASPKGRTPPAAPATQLQQG